MLIKNHTAANLLPSIVQLHDIAMRYIFDRPSVTLTDCRIMEEGIVEWSKKIDINDGDKREISRVINALCAEERGHFERAKSLLAKNKIHYRKFYSSGLPYINDPGNCRTFGRG